MEMLQRVDALPDLGDRGINFYRRRVARFTRFEQVLAFLIMGDPIALFFFGETTPLSAPCDPGAPMPCRDSVSAFYDMGHEPLFYMPLTISAAMFVFNAVLRREHWWNALVGVALAGVVFFNHDAYSLAHSIFAVVFFGATMLVVAWYLPKDLTGSTGVRIPITVPRAARTSAIFGAQILLFVIVSAALNLFVAEVLQLWIVGGHYILHSIKHAEIDNTSSFARSQ